MLAEGGGVVVVSGLSEGLIDFLDEVFSLFCFTMFAGAIQRYTIFTSGYTRIM